MPPPSLELTVIHYNGEVLFAEWEASIGPGFSYFLWRIFDLDGPWFFEQKTTSTRIEQRLELSGSADSGYQMYVTMYIEEEPGPMSQIEYVLTEPPQIGKAVYALAEDGTGTLRLDWEPLAQVGVARYTAMLDSTGGSHQNYPTDTNSVTIQQTFGVPPPTWNASVAPLTFSGISSGPASVPRTLILLAPILTGVSYDGTATLAGWISPDQAGAAKFVVTLSGDTAKDYGTEDEYIDIPGPRDPQYTWKLWVAAASADGVVVGPTSDKVTLILDAPILNELDYDAAQLMPAWQKTPPGVATGYLVQVRAPDDLSNYPTEDVDHTTIDQQLNVDVTYHVRVLATNGIVVGPGSNELIPLTRPATHVSLDSNLEATSLSANWTRPNGGETGFLLQVFKNGNAEPPVSALPPYTLPEGFAAGVAYEMWVRPTGDKVKGPWSPRVPGPWLANVAYGFDRMSRLRTMSWNAVETMTWTYDDAGNIRAVTLTRPPA